MTHITNFFNINYNYLRPKLFSSKSNCHSTGIYPIVVDRHKQEWPLETKSVNMLDMNGYM